MCNQKDWIIIIQGYSDASKTRVCKKKRTQVRRERKQILRAVSQENGKRKDPQTKNKALAPTRLLRLHTRPGIKFFFGPASLVLLINLTPGTRATFANGPNTALDSH